MTIEAMTTKSHEDLVLEILRAAGTRGASHEDFIEAGLATGYIAALRRLVVERGLRIRTDFTTGQPRWALVETRVLAA
jgi:hypothetical protein